VSALNRELPRASELGDGPHRGAVASGWRVRGDSGRTDGQWPVLSAANAWRGKGDFEAIWGCVQPGEGPRLSREGAPA
jgi:hypothetical protein